MYFCSAVKSRSVSSLPVKKLFREKGGISHGKHVLLGLVNLFVFIAASSRKLRGETHSRMSCDSELAKLLLFFGVAENCVPTECGEPVQGQVADSTHHAVDPNRRLYSDPEPG